jgi:hypothetical protein
MNLSLRSLCIGALVVGSALAANGCYHIKGATPPSGPTGFTSFPSGAPTPTPAGNCQAFASGVTTAVIETSPEILPPPTPDPTYGVVGEYALEPAGGGFNGTAAVIHLTSADVVQFLNVDTVYTVSAVGLGTSGFPNTPHTFPSGAQNPIGSAIGSGTWSTGRLGINLSTGCYSQPLTLPQVTGGGTTAAYFGDLDRYNRVTNGQPYRNVIVVSAAPANPDARPRPLRLPPPLPHR